MLWSTGVRDTSSSSVRTITPLTALFLCMTPVELPLDINNTYATYESQFGFVERPTHKNTTLDAAKFEVCGHKVRIYFFISWFSRTYPRVTSSQILANMDMVSLSSQNPSMVLHAKATSFVSPCSERPRPLTRSRIKV